MEPEEKKECLEVSRSDSYSSRPKRTLKPKVFSDEFFVFGNHVNSFNVNTVLTQQNEGKHSHFSSSTPIKKSLKLGKCRTKYSPVESGHVDNINKCNDSEHSLHSGLQNKEKNSNYTSSTPIKRPVKHGKGHTKHVTKESGHVDNIFNSSDSEHFLQSGLQNEEKNSNYSSSTPIKKPVKLGKGRTKHSTVESGHVDSIFYTSKDSEHSLLTGLQNEEKHSNCSSTPIKKPVKFGKGCTKQSPIKLVHDDSINNSNDSEHSLQTGPQNETLQLESDISRIAEICQQNYTNQRLTSDTNGQGDLTDQKNALCMSTENESLSFVEESENFTAFKKMKSRELDNSPSERNQTESRNKVLAALEEHDVPCYRDADVSHIGIHYTNLSGKKRKKDDSVCLTLKYPELCENDNSKESSDRQNNLEGSRKMSKRRKIGTTCLDSSVKENVAHNTDKSKTSELSDYHSNSNVPGVCSESINNEENVQEVVVDDLFKSNTAEQRNSSIDLDVAALPQKRPRGRPRKSKVDPLSQDTQTASPSETSLTPISGKRPRGRSRKSKDDPLSQDIQTASPSETSLTPISGKRPRGRSHKSASQEMHAEKLSKLSVTHLSTDTLLDNSSDNAGIPVSLQKRPESPKNTPQILKTDVSHEDSASKVSQEIRAESLSEIAEAITLPKRRRGRPPKYPVNNQSSMLTISAFQTSQVSEHLLAKPISLTCQRCEKHMKTLSLLKLHMMTEHSLMWTVYCPEGIDDSNNVIKKIGHIDCQKCKKRFRFSQYYRHHQIWCGRENEQATCDICQHTLKAMWLQQHIAAHRTQDKKLALKNVQQKNCEDSVEQGDNGEDETPPANKKLKRQAAKNAIKLMSSFHDTTEQDNASSGDEYSKESNEESSDDNDDDDDEEDTDNDKRKGKKSKMEKTYKLGDSSTNEFNISNIWISVCKQGANLSPTERLIRLQDFYAHWLDARVFPELAPKKCDWEPLTSSEKEKYLPVKEESVKFTIGTKKDTVKMEEQTLKFGHTMSLNGTSYFNVGGPIWAVDWCPLPDKTSHEQIVAISADRTMEESPDTAMLVNGPGMIQIWSAGILFNKVNCYAKPVFQYAIAHDSGYVRSICWCPKACFDENAINSGCLKRLGLLAVGCSDGSVLIYCPPQPEELKHNSQSDETRNVFRPQPALVLVPNSKKGCGPCLSLSWQHGGDFKYIIAGYGRGTIFMWDISTTSPLLKVDASTLRPLRCFSFHKLAVLSICWNPRNPCMFVSASFDFNICVWNTESPEQPIGVIGRYSAHQIPRSICWAGPLHNGFFSSCDKTTISDNSRVSFHGLSKTALLNSLMAVTVQGHTACTWDVNFNPFYDVLATCDATGKVKVAQLRMKDIRCKGIGKFSWQRTKIMSTILYQAKLNSAAVTSLSSSSQPKSLMAAEFSDHPQKSVQTCQVISKESKRQENGVTQEQLHHRDEDQECMERINKTDTIQQTSNFLEQSSSNTHPHIMSERKFCNEIDQINIPETDMLEGDNAYKIENVSILNENIASHNSIKSSSISINDLNPGNQQNVTDSSSNHHGTSDSFVRDATPGLESSVNDITSSTEDSASCNKNQTIEFASKDSTVCSELIRLEICKAPLDAPKHDHSTSMQEDKPNTQTTPLANDEILHFHNCRMTKSVMKLATSEPTHQIELEVFGGSNSHAIHRVRMNPNAKCCLWLASGGQSGIVRLDNLSNLIETHSIKKYLK